MWSEIDEYKQLEPDYKRAIEDFEALKKRYEIAVAADPKGVGTAQLYAELQERLKAIESQYERLQGLKQTLASRVADSASQTAF
jgi:hypothetical protein